jgi:sortase A
MRRRRPAPRVAVSVPGERHARRASRTALRDGPPPRSGTRWVRGVSTAFVLAGLLLVADALVTLLWQEPMTHVLASRRQAQLGGQLRALDAVRPPPSVRRTLAALGGDRRRIAFLARTLGRDAAEGSAVGELGLPRLGARMVVVKGTAPGDLRKGPGAYSGRGLPGVPGTAAIAGHRTTYGAPFRHLDELRAGDPITLDMPYARLVYRVERTRIVAPGDVSVLARRGYDRLVLTACHPLYSAAQRIVVFARLERAQPAGALRTVAGPGLT